MLPILPMIELTLIRRRAALDHLGQSRLGEEKAPEWLTSNTLCQSSSVSLSTVLSIVMPALLTKMFSRPLVSITSRTTRR
jgi:hypothetical protein